MLQGSSNLYNFKSHLQGTMLNIAMLDNQTKFVDIRSYSIHTKISVKHIYKFYCKPTLTSFMLLKVINPLIFL